MENTREDGTKYWTGDAYWVDFIQLKKEILEKVNSN